MPLLSIDRAHQAERVSVFLFGAVQIRTDGLITSHFRSARVPALLAYLLLHPSGDVSREEIADRLWPNLASDAARNNLRVTLQYLKRSLASHGLEGALILSDRSRISVDRTALRSDVNEFRDLIRSIRKGSEHRQELLKQAAALAKAPLLLELYDEWIDPIRTELAQDRFSVLCSYSRVLLDTDPRQALVCARRAAAENPYLDEPRELAALALIRMGENSTAIAELRTFAEQLRAQTGVEISEGLKKIMAEADLLTSGVGRESVDYAPPQPFTAFFGRSDELSFIKGWVDHRSQRLLTLTGPGGIGKTRLAVEAQRQHSGKHRSVWIRAEDVRHGAGLLDQMWRTVCPDLPATDPRLQLRLWLQAKPTLLILDNLEQMPDVELSVISELLESTASTKVLATSRKTLGLAGERLLQVEPLDRSSYGLELLIDRVRASQPHLSVDDRTRAKLKGLCDRLEGIPLAIELAAARLVVTSLDELIAGMDRRLDTLIATRASGERHGALRATIDWSFSQLSHETAESIRSLAVLRGSWDREAAAAILNSDLIEASTLVTIGVEQSLITATLTSPQARFRMLECIRDYSREHISTQQAALLESRAADFYLERAQGPLTLDQLNRDWPNIEAALHSQSAQRNGFERGIAVCEQLLPTLIDAGKAETTLDILSGVKTDPVAALDLTRSALELSVCRYQESIHSATRVVEGGDDSRVAKALVLRARAQIVMGELARAQADASLALSLSRGNDDSTHLDALQALAKVDYARYNPDAEKYIREAIELATSLGHDMRVLDAMDTLGCIQVRYGRLEEGEQTFIEVAASEHKLPLTSQARLWSRLGGVSWARGEFKNAKERYERALDLSRSTQDHWMITQALTQLGDALQMTGEFARARSIHEEAAAMRRVTGERLGLATSLRGLARADSALGNFETSLIEHREAIEIGRQLRDEPFLVTVLLPYAGLLAEVGRTQEAKAAALEALKDCKAEEIPVELIDLHEPEEHFATARRLLEH